MALLLFQIEGNTHLDSSNYLMLNNRVKITNIRHDAIYTIDNGIVHASLHSPLATFAADARLSDSSCFIVKAVASAAQGHALNMMTAVVEMSPAQQRSMSAVAKRP